MSANHDHGGLGCTGLSVGSYIIMVAVYMYRIYPWPA